MGKVEVFCGLTAHINMIELNLLQRNLIQPFASICDF